MAIHQEAPPDARPRLSTAGTVARLTLIGIALAGVAGTFAYLGGWLTPNALTPARFTNGFEEVNGVHPGFRRNHAKGVGVSGFFESNGNGVRLSKAAVFQPGRVPVLGRFSLGGGQPDAPDTASARPTPFDEMDTNHDGVVTREEYVAYQKKRFDEFDSNRDGKIDAKEIASSPPLMERNLKTAERMIKEWDKNGDGVVSAEEFQAAAADRFARLCE